MTPFPTEDGDVRQAYAKHLLYEAVTYAIDQAKMKPQEVTDAISLSLRRYTLPGYGTMSVRPLNSPLQNSLSENYAPRASAVPTKEVKSNG